MTILTELEDTIAVQGVFGDPLERGGVTVVPAAWSTSTASSPRRHWWPPSTC